MASAPPIAVVLAGGLGSRVRHLLPDLPKPLALVAGRPFLEWVVRFLRGQGSIRIVLSVGHLAEKIEEFAARLQVPGLRLSCAREPHPLGTAGGLVNALRQTQADSSRILVCNGDSLVLTDLRPLLSTLDNPAMDGAIVAVRVPAAGRYGGLDLGDDQMLRGFSEKRPGAGLVNAGVYLLRDTTIARFPEGTALSLENDVFPALLAQGARIAVRPCDAPFLDIGTEASLGKADAFVREHMRWFE